MSKESAILSVSPQSQESVTPSSTVPINDPTANPTANVQQTPQDMDSARWAALAKKEQKLVHDQLALKKKFEEVSKIETELKTKLTPFQEFELQKSKDPVAALRGLGFSETDIFNWLAQGEKKEPTPEEKAQQIAAAEVEKYKKAQEEKEIQLAQQRDQEILTRFKSRIHSFLDANKTKYEICADYGPIAEKQAYDLVEQVAKDKGEVISLEDAFQAVEDYYAGEYERMSKYTKFQKQEGMPVAIDEHPPAPAKQVSRGTTKTLTNAASPTIASTVQKQESRDQKRERLINMIKQTGLTR